MNVVIRLLSNDGLSLPKSGLLLYYKRPNTEDLILDDADTWDDIIYWGGFVLPTALFSQIGEGIFFSVGGDALPASGLDIVDDPDTNVSTTLYTHKKGLAIYETGTSSAVLAKARKFLGIPNGT